MKERRLGGIEVFRFGLFVQRPATERDDSTAVILNRDDQPITKAIVGNRNIVTSNYQASFNHVSYRDAMFAQILFQSKAVRRRIPEPKFDLSLWMDFSLS